MLREALENKKIALLRCIDIAVLAAACWVESCDFQCSG
jgi:hypothetical protein